MMSNNTQNILQGIFIDAQKSISSCLTDELLNIQSRTAKIMQKSKSVIEALLKENEELKKDVKIALSTVDEYEKKFEEHKIIIQNHEGLFQEEKLTLRNELEIEKGKNAELINSHLVIVKKNLEDIKCPKVIKAEVHANSKNELEEGEIVEDSKKRKHVMHNVEPGKKRCGDKVLERKFCGRCGENGHYSRDVHCNSCNKYGHTRKDCYCRNCNNMRGHVYRYCNRK